MNKNILTLFKNFSIYTIKYILNSVFVLEMILLTTIVCMAKDNVGYLIQFLELQFSHLFYWWYI